MGVLGNLLASSGDDAVGTLAKTVVKAENKLAAKASKYLENEASDLYSFQNYIKRNRAGISDENNFNTVKKILQDNGDDLSTLDNLLDRNVFRDGTKEFKKPEFYVRQAADNVKHGRIKSEVDYLLRQDRDEQIQKQIQEEQSRKRQQYLNSPEYSYDMEYKKFKESSPYLLSPLTKEQYFDLKSKLSDLNVMKYINSDDLIQSNGDIGKLSQSARKNKVVIDAIQKDVDIANSYRDKILNEFKNANKDTKWNTVKHSVSKSKYYDYVNEMPSEYYYDVPESAYETVNQLRNLRKKYQDFNENGKFIFPFESTASPYRITRYSQHEQGGWNKGMDVRYENIPDTYIPRMHDLF